MNSADWASLLPQRSLAEKLFGALGLAILDDWLNLQSHRISDPAFARMFSDYIDLKGVSTVDYNHRLVTFKNRKLLGGIRFFGQDIEKPFVEVIAHNFDSWSDLISCVAEEWKVFSPLKLRLLVVPGTSVPAEACLDMSIHAAPYRSMQPTDNRVSLGKISRIEEVIESVRARYRDLSSTCPALAENISPASADEMREWCAADQIRTIQINSTGSLATVGVLAIAPGSIAWLEGDEVNEEVVLSAYGGNGYAASAQRMWAARRDIDRERLLIGTIDKQNIASRRTASNVGREAVLNYVFVPLESESTGFLYTT